MDKTFREVISYDTKKQGVIFILNDNEELINVEIIKKTADLKNLSAVKKTATKDFVDYLLSHNSIDNCPVLVLERLQDVLETIGYPELISEHIYPQT